MFLRLLNAELRKMRELMTLLTLLAGPGLAGALGFLGAAARPGDVGWARVLPSMTGFWVLLLFPLSAVAFAAFAAQIEHRARGWDHLLMLPAPKWMVFAAKSTIVALAAAAMNVLFLAFVIAGATLGGLISPHGQFTGPMGLQTIAPALALASAASLFMVAAQHWLSQRFSHFIVPILIGIGGVACTLAGLIFQQTDKTQFLPWAVPNQVFLASGADMQQQSQLLLGYGVIGGLLTFCALCVHLSRREMR